MIYCMYKRISIMFMTLLMIPLSKCLLFYWDLLGLSVYFFFFLLAICTLSVVAFCDHANVFVKL